jgi:sigma-E factor negative regulatory protein RseC
MKQEEFGIVIEVKGNVAKVKAARHGDCDNCGACPGDSAIVMDVRNAVAAKPGQKVSFEMHSANMVLAAFVVYAIPLFLATAGAVLGWFLGTQLGQPLVAFEVGGGIVGFALALVIIKLYDKALKQNVKTLPVITRILK